MSVAVFFVIKSSSFSALFLDVFLFEAILEIYILSFRKVRISVSHLKSTLRFISASK